MYDYTENIQSNVEFAIKLYGEDKVIKNLYSHMNYIVSKLENNLFSNVLNYYQNVLTDESSQILTTLITGKNYKADSYSVCFNDMIKYLVQGGKL